MQANGSSLLITLNSALKSQYVLFHPQKTNMAAVASLQNEDDWQHRSFIYSLCTGLIKHVETESQSIQEPDISGKINENWSRANSTRSTTTMQFESKVVLFKQQLNWTIPTVYILPYTLRESTSMPLLFLFPNVCTLVCAHNDIALLSETLSKMRPKPKECVILHGPN